MGVRMTPASQDSPPAVQETQSDDGSHPVTLKICECFFDQGKEALEEIVEVILEEEKDSGSVRAETDEEKEEDEDDERLSLVNETGSCSGEDDGLIDQDDSIYQV